MRYRNCLGELIRPAPLVRTTSEFIANPSNITMRSNVARNCAELIKRLGIKDAREYLVNAVRHYSVVIVQRDDVTLDVACNKLCYVVDFETLEILNVVERTGFWL